MIIKIILISIKKSICQKLFIDLVTKMCEVAPYSPEFDASLRRKIQNNENIAELDTKFNQQGPAFKFCIVLHYC